MEDWKGRMVEWWKNERLEDWKFRTSQELERWKDGSLKHPIISSEPACLAFSGRC